MQNPELKHTDKYGNHKYDQTKAGSYMLILTFEIYRYRLYVGTHRYLFGTQFRFWSLQIKSIEKIKR